MKESQFIVDRIEGRSLVLQNRNAEIIIIDKTNVDNDVNEGDVLIKVDKNKYIVSKDETKGRKTEIDNLMKGMWEDWAKLITKKLKIKKVVSFMTGLFQF